MRIIQREDERCDNIRATLIATHLAPRKSRTRPRKRNIVAHRTGKQFQDIQL